MKQKYITNSAEQTKEIGKNIAKKILNLSDQKERAVIIAIKGELGSGKTTFIQGLAKELGIKHRILSPTFILMRNYKIPKIDKRFYHIDCYRIKQSQELSFLNLEKLFLDSKNIIATEWPEKIKNILPQDIIVLEFKHKKQNQREIHFKAHKKQLLF